MLNGTGTTRKVFVAGGSLGGLFNAITRSLAQELGPRKIRVNAVDPGVVETEGLHATGISGSDFERQAVAQAPLGRIGQPQDILEAFAAELTAAAYPVALRHGMGDKWLDLQLELWRVLTETVKKWAREWPPAG
jgi:hypothetical protein